MFKRKQFKRYACGVLACGMAFAMMLPGTVMAADVGSGLPPVSSLLSDAGSQDTGNTSGLGDNTGYNNVGNDVNLTPDPGPATSNYYVEYVVNGERSSQMVSVTGTQRVPTPIYSGQLYTPGKVFKGWLPEIADYVDDYAEYVAQFAEADDAVTFKINIRNLSEKIDPALIGTVDVKTLNTYDDPTKNKPTDKYDPDKVFEISKYEGGTLSFSASDVKKLKLSNLKPATDMKILGARIYYENGFYTDLPAMQVLSGELDPILIVNNMTVELYYGFEDSDYTKFITEDNSMRTDTFTITYDTQGGGAIGSQGVPSGASVELPKPVREGYKFIGWFDREVAGEEVASPLKAVENIKLYAYWQNLDPSKYPDDEVKDDPNAKYFTVKFNTMGGSSVGDQQVQEGKAATLPTPVREGYKFMGWFEKEVGGGAVKEFYPKADTILYAHWTLEKQDDSNIGDNTNPGDSDNKNPGNSDNKNPDGTVTDDKNPGNSSGDDTNGDVDADKKFTLTFDSQGGTPVVAITGEKGFIVTFPEPPTREGYDFDGWYTKPNSGDKVTGVILKANVTLYAHWNRQSDKVSVTYIDGVDGKSFTSVTYEASIGDPTPAFGEKDPVYVGYVFKGWSPSVTEKVTGTVVYKAVWEPIKEKDDSEVSGEGKNSPDDDQDEPKDDSDNPDGGPGSGNGGGGNTGRTDSVAASVKTSDMNAGVLYSGMGAFLVALFSCVILIRRKYLGVK